MPFLTGDDAVTPPETLTPGEVAALFRVDIKTVALWAQEGRITSFRTLGGHRRYLKSEVIALWARHLTPAR